MSTRTTTTTCRLCTGPYLVRRGEDIVLCARHWNAWLDRYALDPDAPDAPCAAHRIAQEVTRAQTGGSAQTSTPSDTAAVERAARAWHEAAEAAHAGMGERMCPWDSLGVEDTGRALEYMTAALAAAGAGGDGPEARDCEACNGTGIGVGRRPDGRWAETDCSTCDSSGVAARGDAVVQRQTGVEWGVRYPDDCTTLCEDRGTAESDAERFDRFQEPYHARVVSRVVGPWREVEGDEDHA